MILSGFDGIDRYTSKDEYDGIIVAAREHDVARVVVRRYLFGQLRIVLEYVDPSLPYPAVLDPECDTYLPATARRVVDAAVAMLRSLPSDVEFDLLRAHWHSFQRELGWDGSDVRNRLDPELPERFPRHAR